MDFKNTHFRAYVFTGHKLGKSALRLHEELQQVFGEASGPSLRTLQRWISDIKAGSFTIQKKVSPGRPRSTRMPVLVRSVEDTITKDPRLSTRDVANSLNTDNATVHRILTESLDMRLVCSVWVPADLSEKNKIDRIACCRRILRDVGVRHSGVYCVEDELWVNWAIVKSKQQNATWLKKGGKRSQAVKPKLTNKKTMLLVAFTCSPARFSVTPLPKGVTIDAEYMVDFLKATARRFNNLKTNRIKFKKLTLQMDNARPHSAARTQEYLKKTGVKMLPQSPYSPDLNMCDRFLFTRLQEHCRAVEYADGDELYQDVQRFLRRLPEELLKRELKKLREHCRAVIREGGAYVTN